MSIVYFLSSRLLLCNLLASTAATNPLDKPSRGNNDNNGSTYKTNLFQRHDAHDSVGVLDTMKNLFELSQTSASAVVSLTNVGNNGSPPEVFPLGICMGDCDNGEELISTMSCVSVCKFPFCFAQYLSLPFQRSKPLPSQMMSVK